MQHLEKYKDGEICADEFKAAQAIARAHFANIEVEKSKLEKCEQRELQKIQSWLESESVFGLSFDENTFWVDFGAIAAQLKESKEEYSHYFHFSAVIRVLQLLGKIRIQPILNQIKCATDQRSLVFLGEPGTGKTHGAAAEAERLLNDSFHIPILIQARDISATDTWKDILISTLGLANSWSEEEILQGLSSLAHRKRIHVLDAADHVSVLPKIIVFVDGVDESSLQDKWIERVQETKAITDNYPSIRFCFMSRPYVFNGKDTGGRIVNLDISGDVPTYKLFDSYVKAYDIDVSSAGWVKYALTTPLALKLFCELNKGKKINYHSGADVSVAALLKEKIRMLEIEYCKQDSSATVADQNIFKSILMLANSFSCTSRIERNQIIISIEKLLSFDLARAQMLASYLENYGILRLYCEHGSGLLSPDVYYYYPGIQGYFDYASALMLIDANKSPQNIDFSKCKKLSRNALYTLAIISIQKFNYLITNNDSIDSCIDSSFTKELLFFSLRHTNASDAEQYKPQLLQLMSDNAEILKRITNNIVLPLARETQHPLGVPLLNEFLLGFEHPAQRDVLWSVPSFLRESDGEKWCSFSELALGRDQYPLTASDTADGLPTVYAWALSTVDNVRRQTHRVEIMKWSRQVPDEFYKLFIKFSAINDPQIRSDIFAILMSLLFEDENTELLNAASKWLMENILAPGKIEENRDIAIRYYSTSIVRKAISLNIIDPEVASKYLPPFIPTSNDIALSKEALAGTYMGGYEGISYDLGVTVESTTFIFASLKIWNHKTSIEEVINESKKLYNWKDIRIIDASKISLWLRSHTAIAVWFANVMGKSVRGVRTVEDYWKDYAETTSPILSKEFFLTGRETQNKRLTEWIAERSGTHAVVAESKMEAILFVAACLLTDTKESAENMCKALVIEGVEQWEELVISDEKDCILIPVFNFTEDIRCPISMRIILPMGMYTPVAKITRNIKHIKLEKRTKKTYHQALEALGYATDDFAKIETGTKRRFLPLYRKITTVITRRQPQWLSLGNIEDLIPAFLVGGWNGDMPGDVAAIQEISGENYDTYIQKISKWLTVEDAPIFKVFNTYQMVSVQDMWDFMYEMLSDVQIKRLEQCVYSAFSEEDTTFELPEDKWFMSSVYGKGPRCSSLLREGLIISLILLAEQESRENNCNLTSPRQYVNHIVKTVLAPIRTWQQWNTIAPSLSLLTEASPIAVLDKLEAEIGLDESEIWHLFNPPKDIMFGGTYYTHILWALENMVWYKESVVRAIKLLAAIGEKKLEYTISNSPNNSLYEIFCIWHPQSCLSCSERIQMLKNISEAFPETMWKLMENLLPNGRSHCMTISKPRFHYSEAGVEEGVTYKEYNQTLQALVSIALNAAKNDSHWTLIIKKAPLFFAWNTLWPDLLLKFGKENATPSEVKNICDTLRAEISRHREFCNSDWALPEKSLQKLETVFIQLLPDDIDQYTYLFKYHPDLLDPVPYDKEQDSYESNRKRVHQKRLDAIRAILDRFGVDELINFTKDAEEVDELAEVLTEEILNGSYEFELILRVKSLSPSLYGALLYKLYHINGLEALLSALDNDMLTPEEKADILCRGPLESSVWDKLDAVGEGVPKYYWEHISEYQLYDRNHSCYDFMLSQLLKYGRPFSAVRIISMSKYSNSAVIIETLKKCCELQAHKEANGATIKSLSQHDVLELFEMIYSDQNIDLETLVQLEIAYLVCFKHKSCPKGIAKYLHQNPTEYVDLIAQNYKSDAGTENTIPERSPAQRQLAYDIVDIFTIIPGCSGNKVDKNELLQWVNSAETYATNISYRNSFMHCLGHLLSYSPVGEDGIFPHEAVRDCIEKLHNEKLVNGFIVGKENQRGVYSVTGGLAEKEIAEKYKSNANALRIMYPQTAAVLDKLSESYRDESLYEQKRELLDYRG